MIRGFLLRLTREDKGQDLIEYALLAGFIALGSVVFITSVGESVGQLFNVVDGELQDAAAVAAS